MEDASAHAPLPPDALGDYRVARALSPGQSFLALAPSARQVVLKLLDDDCLLRGKLHPSISDRLGRVRELAHVGVANLYAVERIDGRVFLVWEYVKGNTFDDHAAALGEPAELAALARELILTIEALNALGIVHGQIHGGNVIVCPRGTVKLTHVSPLLYDDPANDAHDALQMLAETASRRGWESSRVGKVLTEAAAARRTLAEVRYSLASGAENGPRELMGTGTENLATARGERSPRRRTVLAAGLTAALGAAIALGVVWAQVRRSSPRLIPPEASPEALTGGSR